MKSSWLVVSIVPLLAYGSLSAEAGADFAEHSELIGMADEQDEQSLSDFFAENQEMLMDEPISDYLADQNLENEESDAAMEAMEETPVISPVKPRAKSQNAQKPALRSPKSVTESGSGEYDQQRQNRPKNGMKNSQKQAANAQEQSEDSLEVLPKAAPARPKARQQATAKKEQQKSPAQKSQGSTASKPNAAKRAPLGQVSQPKGQKKTAQAAKPAAKPRSNVAQSKQPSSKSNKTLADSYSNSYSNQQDDDQGNGNMNSSSRMSSSHSMQNTWDNHRLAVGEVGWYVNGEFLWWKANENGLDYAVTKKSEVFHSSSFNGGSPLDGLAGKMHTADYEWKPGFRIDLGYRSNHDAWEIFGEYTWYRSHNNKDSEHPPLDGEQPALAGTLDEYVQASPYSSYVNRASSELDLFYNVGDISLARRFDVSKNILLRLFAGARGAYMKREWEVEYFCQETGQQTKHNLDWNFRGFGLRLGMGSDWYLDWGFSLFATGSVSTLYGKHHDHVKTESTFDPWNPLQKAPLEDKRNVYNTQIIGGLAWSETWDPYAFKIYAAWEVNGWYNLAEHYRVGVPNSAEGGINVQKVRNLTTSTFSLQGLTLGFMVEF